MLRVECEIRLDRDTEFFLLFLRYPEYPDRPERKNGLPGPKTRQGAHYKVLPAAKTALKRQKCAR